MDNKNIIKEIFIDPDCSESDFREILTSIFPEKCYIYCEIPDCYNDFLVEISDRFNLIATVPSELFPPRGNNSIGFVEDFDKTLVYDFYEIASTNLINLFYTDQPFNISTNELNNSGDLFDFFEKNVSNYVTVGHDGAWLTVISKKT